MVNEERNMDGDNESVGEQAAASPYRGTIWALISIAAFVVIAAIVLFGYVLKSATDGKQNETPAQLEQKRQ